MVAILQNIRAVPSAIRPELLMPCTLEFEDCAVVRSGVPPTFYSDDGGDQTESTLPPINMQYIDMNIRRPFCTDGHWNLTVDQFRNHHLFYTSTWNYERFINTQTIQLSTKQTRESMISYGFSNAKPITKTH